MQYSICSILLASFLLISVTTANSVDIPDQSSNSDKIGIYFPYNYRQNANNINWSGTQSTVDKEHALQMLGIGFKYFINQQIFFDLSKKFLITLPKIGQVTTTGPNTYNSIIGSLDVYTLSINYFHELPHFAFYFGVGTSLNNIEFVPFGKEAVGTVFDEQFYTWLFRLGIEKKIINRLVFNISIGI